MGYGTTKVKGSAREARGYRIQNGRGSNSLENQYVVKVNKKGKIMMIFSLDVCHP